MTALSRILYVDDDPDLRAIAEISLRDIGGFTVALCGGGEEALSTAPRFAPQIILLDVAMPGMDGIETFKRLRLLPELEDVPIAFVSAKVKCHDVHAYLALGAAGVIPKPFDVLMLGDHVQRIWQEHWDEMEDFGADSPRYYAQAS
jgi:two-component system, OmpR family, response regulator